MTQGTKGSIVQVIGTVIDVEFPPDGLPAIYNALELDNSGERLVLEVEQHIGNNWVRCLAMGPTEGLTRGVEVIDTGAPISVPVGPKSLGRLFNVFIRPMLQKLRKLNSSIAFRKVRSPKTCQIWKSTTPGRRWLWGI